MIRTTTIRTTLLLLHPFNGVVSRTNWVSRYQKGKSSQDLNEARDDCVLGCSGISWTICKQSAHSCRQITTPTPHHWIFSGRMHSVMPNQQCQSTLICTTNVWIYGTKFDTEQMVAVNSCRISYLHTLIMLHNVNVIPYSGTILSFPSINTLLLNSTHPSLLPVYVYV